MSSIVFIEATKETADAAHCESCEGDRDCFYDGKAAMKEHAQSFPLHRRITYLVRETV